MQQEFLEGKSKVEVKVEGSKRKSIIKECIKFFRFTRVMDGGEEDY